MSTPEVYTKGELIYDLNVYQAPKVSIVYLWFNLRKKGKRPGLLMVGILLMEGSRLPW